MPRELIPAHSGQTSVTIAAVDHAEQHEDGKQKDHQDQRALSAPIGLCADLL